MRTLPPIKIYSKEYKKRKSQVLNTYLGLWVWVTMSLLLVLGVSVAESWIVQALLFRVLNGQELLGSIFALVFFASLYSFLLARLTLHLSYYIEHKKIAQTAVSFLLLSGYTFFFLRWSQSKPIVFLALGKLLTFFLFSTFWETRLMETRWKGNGEYSSRIFLNSFSAFMSCRWVMIACWLFQHLAVSVALFSVHPLVHVTGWEGLTVMMVFYILFRIFVRNPHAHGEIFVSRKKSVNS